MRKIAKETQIGQLVIDLKIKTEALEKGLETAKKKFQEMERQNEQLQNSNKALDLSFVAMSAGIMASMYKVISIVKDATEEYKSYTQAMSSLSDVADYTENSLDDMRELMSKYGTYMTKADLASTIKNFSLMNMSIEQTDKMLQSLINSAIRNRNANYSVSEAVKVASDGYRQGLSTLSDSAGVTENLSVMLDNYAKSIGKTASQLTEAEQNQAYVNRTMEAAAPFAGAMEGYLDSLAGKQGEYSQALRETKVAYVESIEPMLSKFEEFKTNIVSGLGDIISNNQSAVAGFSVFIVTLAGLVVGVVAVKKAYDAYTKAVIAARVAQEGLDFAVKTSPLGTVVKLLVVATSVIAGVTTALSMQNTSQEIVNEALEKHNKIMQEKIDLENTSASSLESTAEKMQKYIELLEEQKKKKEEFEASGNDMFSKESEEYRKISIEVRNLSGEIKKLTGIEAEEAITEENAAEIKDKYLKGAQKINAIQGTIQARDIKTIQTKQQEASALKKSATEMQEYLSIVRSGDKSTTEYQNAVQKLSKAYPEAVKNEQLLIDVAQDYVNAEQSKADEAWNSSQQMINAYIAHIETAFQDAEVQDEIAKKIGMSWESIAPGLLSVLNILRTMAGYTPDTTPNITPTTVSTPKSSGSSSYSNKKLDNYKKEIEHKKALDQISLKQEIAMYETALRSYAKTADEKMELREKIYALNKELAQKEKEVLDQQTEDYEAYIQQQINSRGAEYDVTERTRDYDKIISMHRNYLNQIMKDERLSLDERKQIYREELSTIRDYEQQKRDLRVETVDNTVTQLTNAITKQLEEQQKKDTDYINEQIEQVEKLKKIKIDAINAEYDAKIEAIEKELQALDKAEQQKSRDEEDAEYERKRLRLEQLIAFEHDAVTKANYQKELDKLVAEYQKTLDKRVLEDKKEALNEQKDLLKEEQDSKTQAVEDEVEKQKEAFNKQLEDLEKYYSEQVEMAQQTAEKMLINVEQNQDNILNLLKSYGNAYEITGQTLGEKLAQGINEGIANKIQNVIQNIQDTIDRGIENKIAEWNRELYRYEIGANKPQQAQTINITQQNYIEQNPELPSETYRKLRNVSENLAAEIAGL